MPLNIADNPLENPVALLNRPEEFLIFYADVEDGKMWCSDCRAVDEQVRKTFTDSPSVGAAGDRILSWILTDGAAAYICVCLFSWKAKDNVFRGEPFEVTDIPTIVKLREGKEVGRLVDQEIKTKLADFVRADS
ncbi:Duf953 domain protein [Mycena venus]|uniref:Duf953 domain protein n=1 Tax=Mycena venus TaxID=2733690 RepID=A0A8H6XU63_9AGAR|nr:Duf953 domain protein [Mycena venus]